MTMPSAQEGRFRFGDRVVIDKWGKIRDAVVIQVRERDGIQERCLLCYQDRPEDSPSSHWFDMDMFYHKPADSTGRTDDHDAPPTPGERCSDCWGSGKLYSLPLTGYPVTCRLCCGTGKAE